MGVAVSHYALGFLIGALTTAACVVGSSALAVLLCERQMQRASGVED